MRLDCFYNMNIFRVRIQLTIDRFKISPQLYFGTSFVKEPLETKDIHEIIHDWNTLAGRIPLGKRSSACSGSKQDHMRTHVTGSIDELLCCYDIHGRADVRRTIAVTRVATRDNIRWPTWPIKPYVGMSARASKIGMWVSSSCWRHQSSALMDIIP